MPFNEKIEVSVRFIGRLLLTCHYSVKALNDCLEEFVWGQLAVLHSPFELTGGPHKLHVSLSTGDAYNLLASWLLFD